MVTFRDLPLRDRKQALTRLGILDATISRLAHKSLEAITVDELCDDVQISKGTFFRYFPRKTDILLYYLQIWNLEGMWITTKDPDFINGLTGIEFMFAWHAKKFEKNPRLLLECIAFRSNEPYEFIKFNEGRIRKVNTAERLLRFPELKGIELIPEVTAFHIFSINIEAAITKKELPKTVDIDLAVQSLVSIFYGTPLIVSTQHSLRITDLYTRQLSLLWAGLRAQSK